MAESLVGVLTNSATLTLLYQVSALLQRVFFFCFFFAFLVVSLCVGISEDFVALHVQRLSRGQRRSNTVIFSTKACIVVRGGPCVLRCIFAESLSLGALHHLPHYPNHHCPSWCRARSTSLPGSNSGHERTIQPHSRNRKSVCCERRN